MKMIKKQPHKSMERLSGTVQESESDTEESPVTSPYCYKETHRQINDAFFLLITVFDTKIRYLPALRIAPKRHCFHCSCNWVCWTSLLSLSQFTQISQRKMQKAGQAKSPTLKEKMAGRMLFLCLEKVEAENTSLNDTRTVSKNR